MKSLKIFMTVLIVLLGIIYFSPPGFAVSAKQDDFVVLGKSGEGGKLVAEKVVLRVNPDAASMIQGRLVSGTEVLVLEKRNLSAGTFYLVLKVGEDGGMTGWVREEYIYEIVSPE